jgi:hypothetical protein
MDTMMMNACLLVKWIWKIAQGSEGLWYKTIKTKYMHGDSFWRSKRKGGFAILERPSQN